ncbi:hypothetical protein [Caballeronia sordidicola]|uniref:Uncharacterized protein n=1 Tax=Caballeronia sordidicola TaxID=196367 RepID=A0A242N6Y2_CABSO|nr:hypothetical protein [Caballeronia sordidicola]OTP79440.1 hypothetical protein PAMC26577_00835 [Caballeronia sordidicola]
MSHSIAMLEVSARTYAEIAEKLRAAGYGHVFGSNGVIDMTGIGIETAPPPAGPVCTCLTNQLGPHYCEVHAA